MSQRIVITDLRVVVVAWIGVSTGAISQTIPYAMIIVPLHTDHLVLPEDRKDLIRIRSKTAHIPQAIDGPGPVAARVVDGGTQGKVVVIAPSKNRDGVATCILN